MFFIAYFLQSGEHRVIPYKWLSGINYESLINNGLNRNRNFRAFYTNDKEAFGTHGVPKETYVPDPNAQGQMFPNAGWYLCRIRKFHGN